MELHDIASDDIVPLPQHSSSSDQLLSVLPKQSLSGDSNLLVLSFSHAHPAAPNPLSVRLQVDASPGCGGIAWPAGQILASYLVHKGPEYISSKTVIELGSGTGLVGLVAGALSDADVWITDQAALLAIMQGNVTLNDLGHRVKVAELDWAQPTPLAVPRPQVILAADCVYFEPAFPLLVQTLSDLSTPETEILFCYKKRRKADKRFFTLLKKSFTWSEVLDDPNREFYNREAITLVRITKFKDANTCPRPRPTDN